MSAFFSGTRLIVVKVGSSLLVDGASGTLRRDWLVSLCADVAALRRQGAKVILVSSGSIALGRNLLKLPKGVLKLEESQAAAAAGQRRTQPEAPASWDRRCEMLHSTRSCRPSARRSAVAFHRQSPVPPRRWPR